MEICEVRNRRTYHRRFHQTTAAENQIVHRTAGARKWIVHQREDPYSERAVHEAGLYSGYRKFEWHGSSAKAGEIEEWRQKRRKSQAIQEELLAPEKLSVLEELPDLGERSGLEELSAPGEWSGPEKLSAPGEWSGSEKLLGPDEVPDQDAPPAPEERPDRKKRSKTEEMADLEEKAHRVKKNNLPAVKRKAAYRHRRMALGAAVFFILALLAVWKNQSADTAAWKRSGSKAYETGADSGSDSAKDSASGVSDLTSGIVAGTGADTSSDAASGTGAGTSSDAASGTGADTSSDAVSGTGAGASSDAASGTDSGVSSGAASGTSSDASTDAASGSGSDTAADSISGDASFPAAYDYSRQDALRGDIQTADVSAGILMLVNKEYALPDDYEPELHWLNNKSCAVAEEMYDSLAAMLSDGTDEGMEFVVASGYRSIQKQKELLEEDIQADIANEGLTYEEAYEKETKETMPPGCSEHETGLAVDIVALSYQMLDAGQEQTAENQWLQEHCSEYGFILRYPDGKEDVTGVNYESWHFRYVGNEAAEEITEQGITLEEYLEL